MFKGSFGDGSFSRQESFQGTPVRIPNSPSNGSLTGAEGLNEVTYKTLDKGPKKINQYILGEILGEGMELIL